MKKVIISLLICLLSYYTYSQSSRAEIKEVVNKNGYRITPEKGDFSISIDASPFLSFIGNLFQIAASSPNQAPELKFSAQNPGNINFKKFITDNKAYRGTLRIGISSQTQKFGNNLDENDIDLYKQKALNLGVSFGIENSKIMKNRIRGYYALEGLIDKTPYTGPSFLDFSKTIIGNYKYVSENTFTNEFEETGGSIISIGAGIIIGTEIFIAPKFSVGGEFNNTATVYKKFKRAYNPEDGDEVILDMGGSGFVLQNIPTGFMTLNLYF